MSAPRIALAVGALLLLRAALTVVRGEYAAAVAAAFAAAVAAVAATALHAPMHTSPESKRLRGSSNS